MAKSKTVSVHHEEWVEASEVDTFIANLPVDFANVIEEAGVVRLVAWDVDEDAATVAEAASDDSQGNAESAGTSGQAEEDSNNG